MPVFAINFTTMRKEHIVIAVFVCVLVAISAALTLGGYRLYDYEKVRLVQLVEETTKSAADSLQRANTTLNNIVGAQNDADYEEKIAFAIGMSGNTGKMRIYFNEDDKPKTSDKNPPLLINKNFLKRQAIQFTPEYVKGIKHFDTAFAYALKKRGLHIAYKIQQEKQQSSNSTGFAYTTQPFIINYYVPDVYRICYNIPQSTIFPFLLPYISISALILLMVIGGFIFYYHNYRLQLQLSLFKESLFSNIAHELKTPISSLQLILDADKDSISQQHMQFAASEVKRMKLMVDKILSYGKMSKEQFALNKELLNLDTIVREAIDTMDISAKQSGATISYNIIKEVKTVGDKTLLVNAITTIIDNAIKYNAQIPAIDIQLSKLNNLAIITITDNGIGIHAAYHKKVFEPFFRIPTGNIHNIKGHGLGLSFAKQTITLHEGNIHITNALPTGSIFTITLPSI